MRKITIVITMILEILILIGCNIARNQETNMVVECVNIDELNQNNIDKIQDTQTMKTIETKETKESIEDVNNEKEADLIGYFKKFFSSYFSFTEEELKILNAEKNIDVEEYGEIVFDKLGSYLTDDNMALLGTSTIRAITMPHEIFINGYIVSGQAHVEDVAILRGEEKELESDYEVRVTIDTPYTTSNSFITMLNIEEADSIKLTQEFKVTVTNVAPIKVKRLVENSTIINDLGYVKQINYDENIDDDLVNSFINRMFIHDYKELEDYSIAFKSLESYKQLMEKWHMQSIMSLNENYDKVYEENVFPYLNGLLKLEIIDDLIININCNSTKLIKIYDVIVPVKATYDNNEDTYMLRYQLTEAHGKIVRTVYLGEKV